MIEKLDVMKDTRNVIDRGGIVHTVANFTAIEKINELVDAVNKLQESHAISERIRIDGLDDPFAENVPEPIKLYVCADGSVYDNLDVAKSHSAGLQTPAENVQDKFAEQCISPEQMGYIKLDNDSLQKFLKAHPEYNENGMLNLSSCSVKVQDELDRTRKALDIAMDALTTIGGYLDYNDCVGIALDAKDEIYKVLEQKD